MLWKYRLVTKTKRGNKQVYSKETWLCIDKFHVACETQPKLLNWKEIDCQISTLTDKINSWETYTVAGGWDINARVYLELVFCAASPPAYAVQFVLSILE